MRWLGLFLPVVLLVVAGAIYLRASDNERFPDESLAIWGNPAVTQPGWSGVGLGRFYDFSTESRPAVRPAATLAHRLEYGTFHQSRRAFQWVLILAHGLTSIALFALFRAQFGSPVSAFAAALLFVAHPALSASVLTLPGLSESIALLCSVVVLLAARWALSTSERADGKPWAALLVVWTGLLIAIWSKEIALVLVPTLLVWAWASRPGRSTQTDGGGATWRSSSLALLSIGVVAVAVLALIHRLISWELVSSAGRAPAIMPDAGEGWARRALLGVAGVPTYLQLAFLPLKLGYTYDFIHGWSGAEVAIRLTLGVLVLAGLAMGLVFAVRRRAAISALWFGFTLFSIIGATGVIAPIGDYLSERMMYFIVPGLLGLGLMLHQRVLAPRGELWSASTFVLAVIVAGAFGVRTSLREQDHQTLEQMIRKQIGTHPESAQAHYDLGNQYLARGQFAAARDSYERATELRSDLWMAWTNIGASYFAQEDFGLARRAFTKVIDGSANDEEYRTAAARAHYNRALVLMRQNENAAAVQDLEAALVVFPDHMAAHANLGFIYRNSPQHDEKALEHLERALELDQDPERRKALEESITLIEDRADRHARESIEETLSTSGDDIPDSTSEE